MEFAMLVSLINKNKMVLRNGVLESCGMGVRPHPDLLLKEKAIFAQP
jgi:hypothetical protein